MNLVHLLRDTEPHTPHRDPASGKPLIVNFHRGGLLYAERRDGAGNSGRPWTKHDGKGLKGPVAHWAQEFFAEEPALGPSQKRPRMAFFPSYWPQACQGTGVLRVDTDPGGAHDEIIDEIQLCREHRIRAVVDATGFEAAPSLPEVRFRGAPVDLAQAYAASGGALAPGLFGTGIGFPEPWTDPEGSTEPRVGFGENYAGYVGRLLAETAAPGV